MRKLKLGMRKNDGQILILVLLVVVVALAVGLSVSARNLTNLRTSTQAEQSQRAFTAAEGGVEDVLSKLNKVANVISQPVNSSDLTGNTTCTSTGTGQANCTLQNATSTNGVTGTVNVVASNIYEKTVEPGDVAQINLEGFAGQVDIEWAKSGDPANVSLEFTFICDTAGGSNNSCGYATSLTPIPGGASYGQHRVAFTTDTSMGGNQSGFTQCPNYNPSPATGAFGCKNSLTIPTAPNVKILRMKPFWDRVTIRVTPRSNSAQFPVQTFEITSIATTDTGVSRKVEVKRDALPQLPAVFDYVLFSGGDIIK